MNILLIFCCAIIAGFAVYGYRAGFVKVIVPVISGLLSLFLLFLLKDWLLGFLFRWAAFSGEHVLARIVVILLICLLGSLAFKWLFGILRLLTKLPLVHGANKLLGFLFGAIEGVLMIWLLFYLVWINEGIMFGKDFGVMICQNSFLKYLYQNNLIAHLMTTLFGSWIA